MFKNYSSEQIARLVSAVFIIFGFFGFNGGEVSPEQIAGAIDAILINGALIVTFLANVYGYFRRYFKGDVTLGGRRK